MFGLIVLLRLFDLIICSLDYFLLGLFLPFGLSVAQFD
jgi:hypothetical protein